MSISPPFERFWATTRGSFRVAGLRTSPAGSTLAGHEKDAIEAALRESKGRVAGPFGAAAPPGVPPSTLESKIKALKIDKRLFKSGSSLVGLGLDPFAEHSRCHARGSPTSSSRPLLLFSGDAGPSSPSMVQGNLLHRGALRARGGPDGSAGHRPIPRRPRRRRV